MESHHTFHESSVGPAVVVEVRAVDVSQAVISQLGSVAETLQDRVHEALRTANTTKLIKEPDGVYSAHKTTE